MARYIEHSFYCIQCGKKGIPCQRRAGHEHGKHHRKKLYCLYCGEEVNHIECRNDNEVAEFKENFEKGAYKEEAQTSIDYIKKENLNWSW